MNIPTVPPHAYAPLVALERTRLLDLLGSLDPGEWSRPTPCPGWDVAGLAAHLLGNDLSFIAGHRDGHHGTPAPQGQTEEEFIAWLDELMVEWVHAARRLSPRLIVDLLAWSGPQLVDTIAAADPTAVVAEVSWASATLAPAWLDHARELSERWIHRQQLLEALGQPSDLRSDVALPVLDGLRWAYPYRLRACPRPTGTTVRVEAAGPTVAVAWTLVADGPTWRFTDTATEPAAALHASDEQLWRLLTNNLRPEANGSVTSSGDRDLVDVLLSTRAIIGSPT